MCTIQEDMHTGTKKDEATVVRDRKAIQYEIQNFGAV